jgi:hypothetical protein
LLKIGSNVKGAEHLVESAGDFIVERLDFFKKSREWDIVAADASLLLILLDRSNLK